LISTLIKLKILLDKSHWLKIANVIEDILFSTHSIQKKFYSVNNEKKGWKKESNIYALKLGIEKQIFKKSIRLLKY